MEPASRKAPAASLTEYGDEAGGGGREVGGGGEKVPAVGMFGCAGQAEMVRAEQKDEIYAGMLQGMVSDSAQSILGGRLAGQWDGGLRALSDLTYHGLTTLRGVQTLGEEYCDMQQVEAEAEVMPRTDTRAALVAWKALVPYLFQALCALTLCVQIVQTKFISAVCSQSEERRWLSAGTRAFLYELLPEIRAIKDAVRRFHLALFYLRGEFYNLSHRLTNVRHVALGGRGGSGTSFSLLGWLILFEHTVGLAMLASKIRGLLRRGKVGDGGGNEGRVDSDSEAEEEGGGGEGGAGGKCMLCLEKRTCTTATPCGHLFCWHCIVEWCGSKAECPLCRQKITEQSLTRIWSYSPSVNP